jgi:microcystin degradation protein MlrC
MQIGIACFTHESNTFAVKPTTLADFQVLTGQAVIERYTPTFHEVGGFIAGADEYDYTIQPLLAADATPGGTLTAETYETIIAQLLEALQGANIDGLLLALHGAMVVEGYPQADAETVRRVRAAVGPDFPVVVTHDYHGNVPTSLVADADALVIY